jgi:hypothetical protein
MLAEANSLFVSRSSLCWRSRAFEPAHSIAHCDECLAGQQTPGDAVPKRLIIFVFDVEEE